MIRRFLVLVLLSIVAISASSSVRLTRSASQEPCSQDHEAWVTHTLEKMETIKPGMTRGELLKVFTTEGGLSTDYTAHSSVGTVHISKWMSSSRRLLGQTGTTMGL